MFIFIFKNTSFREKALEGVQVDFASSATSCHLTSSDSKVSHVQLKFLCAMYFNAGLISKGLGFVK